MNKVSGDIHFLRGNLQRVHSRYVEAVDSNIPDVTENTARLTDFLRILSLLRSKAAYLDSVFTKTKEDY